MTETTIVSHTGDSEGIPAITDDEEDQLREEFNFVLTTTNKRNNGNALHLHDGGGDTLCTSPTMNERVEKKFSVFPHGYREVCRHCGQVWRRTSKESISIELVADELDLGDVPYRAEIEDENVVFYYVDDSLD